MQKGVVIVQAAADALAAARVEFAILSFAPWAGRGGGRRRRCWFRRPIRLEWFGFAAPGGLVAALWLREAKAVWFLSRLDTAVVVAAACQDEHRVRGAARMRVQDAVVCEQVGLMVVVTGCGDAR